MIETSVQVGKNRIFELTDIILVHRDGSNVFATRHPPIPGEEGGPPQVGPGQPLNRRFLTRLAKDLRRDLPAEVFPENLLCRTDDRVAWWTPAQTRLMFYSDARYGDFSQINGFPFPHPALVWMVKGRSIYVRALDESRRPSADTPLRKAPYWNVYASGNVCVGDARFPTSLSVDQLPAYEEAFFTSRFTHPNADQELVVFPGGFIAMWHSLIDAAAFPAAYLKDAQQSLGQLLTGTQP